MEYLNSVQDSNFFVNVYLFNFERVVWHVSDVKIQLLTLVNTF